MRHAISCSIPSSPTTSVSSGPRTEPSPISSSMAVTTVSRSGSKRSHRLSSSTRLAKREECGQRPAATSSTAVARSASTNSRSAVAVALLSAPLIRTTPDFLSSVARLERRRAALGFALTLPLALPLPFFEAFAGVAAAPNPVGASIMGGRFCSVGSSGVPLCRIVLSVLPRSMIARSASACKFMRGGSATRDVEAMSNARTTNA
mmetsp:Transcript_27556/g.70186  ORF Transcript_27556/g.70186 Transcript_27556/m.70186 type:complete len:205 (+) Transcript_27556:815-1429(+)